MNLRKLLLPVALSIGAWLSGSPVATAQTTVTVGTGTATSSGSNGLPIYRSSATSSFNYSRSASLYTTTDLSSVPNGATITAVAFNKTTAASLRSGYTATFNLLLKNTSNTALNGTTDWATYTSGASTGYSTTTLDSTAVSATPWLSFAVSPGFVYTGGSLEIYTDWAINAGSGTGTSYATAAFPFAYTTTTGIQSAGTSNSTALTGTTVLSTTQTRLNNIQITYTAPPPCSGTPLSGTTTTSASNVCAGSSVTLALTGGSAASGLSYQLQSSTNNTTFTNVGTASATPSFTASTAAGTTYYRIVTTCVSTGQNASSTSVTVTGQGPIATFPYTDTFSSSGLPSCWSASAGTGATYQWTGSAADASHGVAGPQSGSGFLSLNVYNASTTYNPYLLNSRSYTLGSTAKQLQYYYYLGSGGYQGTTGNSGSDPYPLVILGTKDNGVTYDTLYRHSSTNSTFATSSATSFWTLNTIVLPASYVNQTASFRFVSISNFGNNFTNQELDEFTVMNVPSCSPPTAVTASAVTSSGATLSWTASISAPSSGYQYEVRTSGAAGSGATGLAASGSTAAGATTASVTGLSANTAYTAYVRSNCGSSTFSAWTGGTSFTTLCSPVTTFPYTDTFSSSGLPSCWSASAGTGATYQWTGSAADASHGVAGPQSGSGFLSLNVYNASTTYNPYLLNSRSYTLGSTAKQLQYYYYLGSGGYQGTTGNSGSDPYPLVILGTKDNGVTYDTLYRHSSTNSTFATSSATSFWTLNTIVLPASYVNQTASFRFVSISNFGNNFTNQELDEFTVMNVPSCSPPTAVTASAVTSSGATLSWTASISAPSSGYQYEVRTSGAAGSGATGLAASGSTAAGATTASVTGLSANTAYTAYVRSNCGSSTFSAWTGGTSFTTLCSPVATFPYTEGFNGSGIPACWSTVLVSGTNNWTTGSSSSDISAPYAGSGFIYKPYNTSTANLISPPFNLSGFGSNQARINLWVYRHASTVVNDSIQFFASTTTATTGATSLLTVKIKTTEAPAVSGAGWYNYTATIPASFNTTTPVYIITSGVTTGGFSSYDIGLDSFRLEQAPSCLVPTGVTVSNVTNNSATISWTAPSPAPANGYRYQIRSGSSVVASGTTGAGVTTVNVTGLAANSIDTVFVRSLCSTADSSGLSTPVIFTTLCNTSALPVAEGFNGLGLPACWRTQVAAIQTGTKISVVSSGSFPTTSPYAGSGMVQYNSYSSTNGGAGSQERLVSLPVSSSGLSTVLTKFYWRNENNPSYTDSLEGVQVQYSTNGTTWTDAGSFIPRHDASLTSGVAQWNLKTVTLPVAASNQATLYVGYRFTSNYGDNMFMDSVRIESCVNPIVNLGNDTAICSGSSVTLNAGNAGASYLWSTGATTQTISVNIAGTYNVRVTNATGCIGRDTIVVTVNPNPTVNLGNDTALCSGNSVTLNAGNAGASYLWSTGATTQTISVATSGTYNVRVTNTSGCIGRDTIVVTVNPNPIVNLGNDTAICSGSSVTLSAGNAGAAYLWSTGATTQTISVSTAGTYNVRVTNATGCIGRDTIVVTVNPRPTVNLGNDTSFCSGGSVTLNAGNAGASYLWSTGATTQTISVATSGTYNVRVTNTSGCIGRDTIVVTVNPNPIVNLGNDTAICSGSSVTLNAGNAGATYLWSTGATTQTISVSTAGTYNVRVTNATGCIGRDTVNITINPRPVAGTITVTNQSPTFGFTISGNQNDSLRGWDFGDGAVDNVGNPTTTTHTYLANGTYRVTFYAANSCGLDTVSVSVTVSNASVGTVALDGVLELFPNPATEFVTVKNSSTQAMKQITVLNAVGAVVREVTVNNGQQQRIDISGLAAGSYLVRVQLDGTTVVRRLQITR